MADFGSTTQLLVMNYLQSFHVVLIMRETRFVGFAHQYLIADTQLQKKQEVVKIVHYLPLTISVSFCAISDRQCLLDIYYLIIRR